MADEEMILMNDHGEFVDAEPPSAYGGLFDYDVERERERSYYEHEDEFRARWRELRKGARE